MTRRAILGLTVLAAAAAFGKGYVPWSGREPHPAVVNPVCGNEPGTVLSLDGEWTFAAFPHAADRYQFFRRTEYQKTWKGERKIRVPGSWQTQGVGEAVPEPGRVCYGGRDKAFPLKHAFYGNCFYRRTFEVPSAWAGKRGTAESCDCWGGLLRSVELEATPERFIDDAWARGDFDLRRAQVKVVIGGEVEKRGGGGQRNDTFSLRATVDGETAQIPLSISTSSLHLEVPLRNFRPWSPEHPNLYTARGTIRPGVRCAATG